ncbi:MAG: leucyl aminopeptidase [Planctomycetota bacterium]
MLKPIINVKMKTRNADPLSSAADVLVAAICSDVKAMDSTIAQLDRKLAGAIAKLKKLGDFDAKDGTIALIYSHAAIPAKRILLLGLGEKKKLEPDTIRKAASLAGVKAVQIRAKNITVAASTFTVKLDPEATACALAEGFHFGSYCYDEYVTSAPEPRPALLNIELADADRQRINLFDRGVRYGNIVGRAQSYARTIANRPGNVINPVTLAAEAGKLAAKTAGLTCTIFDEKQLKARGMGGILAVGSGSKSPPRLIVLKYNAARSKTAKPVIALIGKAITFDSGGINLKPSNGMQEMKFDKSGGAAVMGAFKAISELRPRINVYGIIPSAENLPGASSYRPGDIIKTFSGKTVEVQNTDAEGRMILTDALHYATKLRCGIIVDIATLTGACKVALGTYMAGVMGNDDKLIEQLKTASKQSGEKIWHMPSGPEYLEEMKSTIADLKNIGSKWGGACTGAAFLGEFAGKTKWAHIDIAGVDCFEKPSAAAAIGASGFGVRLLTSFLMAIDQKTA